MKNSARYLLLPIFYFLLSPFAVDAKAKEEVLNELPAPYNIQAVTLQKTITLTWQWVKPMELPAFKELVFEIKRNDGKIFTSKRTTYADDDLVPGRYSYTVRVRGRTKDKGKPVLYVSDYTPPVEGLIQIVCKHQPSIQLTVEPTQTVLTKVASLRFHLRGIATVEAGCTLNAVRYHLDSGTGIVKEGNLTVDSKGRFDTFVNAIGPEDEIPTGRASFAVTATAKNEVGTSTSDVYTLDIELRDPYAPH